MAGDPSFWPKFKKALTGLKIILFVQFGFTALSISLAVIGGADGSGYGALGFLFGIFAIADLFYLFCAAIVCFIRSAYQHAQSP